MPVTPELQRAIDNLDAETQRRLALHVSHFYEGSMPKGLRTYIRLLKVLAPVGFTFTMILLPFVIEDYLKGAVTAISLVAVIMPAVILAIVSTITVGLIKLQED